MDYTEKLAVYFNKYDIPQDIHWLLTGVYFGYPNCCIEWFLKYAGEHNTIQAKVNNNRGFMPCPACAERVYYGEIKIHDLIKDRICKHKSPHEGTEDDYLNYLNAQQKLINTLMSVYKQ